MMNTKDIIPQDALLLSSLLQDGVALVDIPEEAPREVFSEFRSAFPSLRTNPDIQIPLDAIDAHSVTGFHGAGELSWSSRSNLCREGLVFSNGATLAALSSQNLHVDKLEKLLHKVAKRVLQSVEARLELPSGWFQENMGGGDMQSTSQWHLKNYVFDNSPPAKASYSPDEQAPPIILLPSHTDPSLLSVIILDRPGKQPGSQGLEYCSGGEWKEVAQSGHGVAIVMLGSVLSYITGGYLPAPRHRVRVTPETTLLSCKETYYYHRRAAATLFLRPRGSVFLLVPPSPSLQHVHLKHRTTTLTFAEWNARVSKNYRRRAADNNNARHKHQNDDDNNKKKDTKDVLGKVDEGCGVGVISSTTTINNVVVFRDEYTELSLFQCAVKGREKYLGGELSPQNGKIYTIPGHATKVLVIDAPQLELSVRSIAQEEGGGGAAAASVAIRCIGPDLLDGDDEFKWLRGVCMPNGLIVGIPCHAGSVLCIDPSTDRVFTVDWDDDDEYNDCDEAKKKETASNNHARAPSKSMKWKWHGGVVAPSDGCLYCIPQRAESILKFDANTLTISFFGGPFPGRNKWYGGLLGKDGAIYGVNQNHPSILRIDPLTQSATLHGSYPEGGHKWHGGVLGPDGCVYGIPANADCILKIEPGLEPRITTFGGGLRTGQHRDDGKYKYLGGTVGSDGNIYFFPSDSDYVLQVDPRTETCREVGPNLRDLETMRNNKWQNGFASGDCLYGIPLKGNTVIRIRIRKGEDPEVSTIGGPFLGLNKWEGGVMSKSGAMYCMPLNHSKVLQIRPLSVVKQTI